MEYPTNYKQKLKWILLAFIPAAFIIYFNNSGEKREGKEGTVINLTLENSAGLNYVYLKELNVGDVHVIDSLDIRRVSKGSFFPEVREAGFFLLQIDKQEPVVLLIEPNEKLEVVLHGKGNLPYQVNGSPGSALLRDYRIFLGKGPVQVDSLKKIFNADVNTGQYAAMRSNLDTAFLHILETQQLYARNFVATHLQSLASLYVINQRLGPQRLLNMQQDFALFNSLDSALMLKYPNNKHAIDHHKRISEAKRKIAEQKLAKENQHP